MLVVCGCVPDGDALGSGVTVEVGSGEASIGLTVAVGRGPAGMLGLGIGCAGTSGVCAGAKVAATRKAALAVSRSKLFIPMLRGAASPWM